VVLHGYAPHRNKSSQKPLLENSVRGGDQGNKRQPHSTAQKKLKVQSLSINRGDLTKKGEKGKKGLCRCQAWGKTGLFTLQELNQSAECGALRGGKE